jgi:TRAP transporter 4TM/12TM fusion protein
MADTNKKAVDPEDIDLDDLVASSDTGGRAPAGPLGKLIAGIALTWSLFQLYIASDIPFLLAEVFGNSVLFPSDEARAIHLAFALVLAALAYPLFKNSPRDRIPFYDWGLALIGAACCLYLVVFKAQISTRPGLPITADIVISVLGMIAVMIATFRSLGLPLVIVASVFLVYVFFGDQPFMPEVIQWKGASIEKAMWHYWMQTEGVFGVALGVSTSMVFLFVLFGSLLDKAGAGNYFIKLAFAMLGHLRGGPAKAAVVSSAMTGLISGSSIANVVTTGTFTIPLMKRVGFSGEKAGSVEVASSVNGQIMPPVMGAAAFLMTEYVGISYLEVVKHALLPAVISYIALFYIVHLEALKADMKALPKPGPARTAIQKLMGVLLGFIIVAVLAAAIYYSLGWTKDVFGPATIYAVSVMFFVAYVALLYVSARAPDLEEDDPNAEVVTLPETGPTARAGYYFLLPILVLVWCLMIERLSPGLAAFWATVGMLFIQITQHPLKAIMRGRDDVGRAFHQGWLEVLDGMISGARNMIGIAVATGAAGIIVGTISLTGAHQIVGEFIEFLSGGSLMFMLVLVAIFSLILGMGLPTTANYIVVSSLMAGVIVEVGAANGLIVPLIAVHLFVFYFGIMADVTPPVGLASFAAAAVARSDPLKTGFTAFFYSLRTVALPFLFIFNHDLLLIDVGWVEAGFIFIVATIAMMLFAAATQGYFFARSKIWESALLLLIAFTLFRPGFWLDQLEDPYRQVPPAEIVQLAGSAPADGTLRVTLEGEELASGNIVEKTVNLPLGGEGSGADRLSKTAGIEVETADGKTFVSNVTFGGYAEQQGIDFDWEIKSIEVEADRMPKEVFYIPALILLAGVIMIQRRRKTAAA